MLPFMLTDRLMAFVLFKSKIIMDRLYKTEFLLSVKLESRGRGKNGKTGSVG